MGSFALFLFYLGLWFYNSNGLGFQFWVFKKFSYFMATSVRMVDRMKRRTTRANGVKWKMKYPSNLAHNQWVNDCCPVADRLLSGEIQPIIPPKDFIDVWNIRHIQEKQRFNPKIWKCALQCGTNCTRVHDTYNTYSPHVVNILKILC